MGERTDDNPPSDAPTADPNLSAAAPEKVTDPDDDSRKAARAALAWIDNHPREPVPRDGPIEDDQVRMSRLNRGLAAALKRADDVTPIDQ